MSRFNKNLLATVMAWLLASVALGPAALAQRVLDGTTVTRYSGFTNYILNPNAQYAPSQSVTAGTVAGVTVSNATATRSTTTPIGEGDTEWNVTITSANGTIDFITSGATADKIGGANCEATADVRGFQSSTKIQVFDGTNVLYTSTFDSIKTITTKVGFLGFPCPSNPSTLRIRITDTATLAATNEIANIYLGRSRNIGTVAQAEHVGTLTYAAATNCQWANTSNYPAVGSYALDNDCGTPSVTGLLTAPATKIPGFTLTVAPGRYYISASGVFSAARTAQGDTLCNRFTDGTTNTFLQCTAGNFGGASSANISQGSISGEIEYTAGGTFTIQLQGGNDGSSSNVDARAVPLAFSVFKLPPASAVVVNPSQQNVNGSTRYGIRASGIASTTSATAAEFCASTTNFAVTATTGTATGPGQSTCGGGNVAVGISVPNVPPGDYEVSFHGIFLAETAGLTTADTTTCEFYMTDGTNQTNLSTPRADKPATGVNYQVQFYGESSLRANVSYSSTATRTWTVYGRRSSGGGICYLRLDMGAAGNQNAIASLRPIQGNSTPVYVRSPIKAAETGTAPAAGFVDEHNGVSGSLTSLTSTSYATTGAQVTTTSGGCFDAWAVCLFDPAATTTVTLTQCAVTRVGTSFSDAVLLTNYTNWSFNGAAPNSGGDFGYQYESPVWRQCSASPITFSALMYANFGTSTMQGTARINYRRAADQ